MLAKIGFSLFLMVFLYMGGMQLEMLLRAPRAEARIESLQKGRKNTTLATIRFNTPDGREHSAVVNAEGQQVGETMTVMYREQDPENTAHAYSPVLYVIPFICFPFALFALYFIWFLGPRLDARRSELAAADSPNL
ncbi:MAG: DUF3592 domain-containing protein [Candidatus Sericytochromatia bacterium]